MAQWVIALVLLALAATPAAMVRLRSGAGPLSELVRFFWVTQSNKGEGEFELDVSNYYNGLINAEGASLPPPLRPRAWRFFRITWPAHEQMLSQPTRGFEMYRLRPNLELQSPAGIVRTNSFGMVDREYELRPPPGIRRIAFLGDSVVRGMGTATGDSLEAQLEERLNQRSVAGSAARYEILNFAVSGYLLTQMLGVAEDRALAFQPHAILVGLSRQHVAAEEWSQHLIRLVALERDLRYPFLREIAAGARLNRADERETAQNKLVPYFDRGFRQTMRELRRVAQQGRAELVVVLLPTLESLRATQAAFAPARKILQEENFAVIDLLDTFREVKDTAPLRVAPGDPHPNRQGHAMLCENLLRKLASDPVAWFALTGRRAE
jgi:lysophospholipase L1-like esterase